MASSVSAPLAAFDGLVKAEHRFDAAASAVSNSIVSSAAPGIADTVDLSVEAAALLSAKEDYLSNLKAAGTIDQMYETSVEIGTAGAE